MMRSMWIRLFLIGLLLATGFGWELGTPLIPIVRADGFVDFEDGVDGQPIQSTIPGLQFTTTQGYDWIYGDWRTGGYNGPYPGGAYYSNGNFFAWLGPNQGMGRIDFTDGCATYLQMWVSTYAGLTADAYYYDGTWAASASVSGNLWTGEMARLRVDAPPGDCFHYVLLHDSGNYWLIDDLSTDASGVPAGRPPVVVIPGLMGSRLSKRDMSDNSRSGVWPPLYDEDEHAIILDDIGNLDFESLYLKENGVDPADPDDFIHSSGVMDYFDVKLLGVKLKTEHFYDTLLEYLNWAGFDVYEFHYDWRMDVRAPLHGRGAYSGRQELDSFIDKVLAETGADQVNIVAHSLGGLVTRAYVSGSPAHAAKVEQAIILGTPYLGAPKSFMPLRAGNPGLAIEGWPYDILIDFEMVREFSENSPSIYQVLPSERYLDVEGGGWYWHDGNQYTYTQTEFLFRSQYNWDLVTMAEELHSVVDDWSYTGDVEFRFIVGTGVDGTWGGIRESKLPWWQGGFTRYDIIPTNGDGTVPRSSASLEGHGHIYRADVPIWYSNGVNHQELTEKGYILDFIDSLLATPPSEGTLARIEAQTPLVPESAPRLFEGDWPAAEPEHRYTSPPPPPEMGTSPFPINSAQVTVYQAAELHVYDTYGNHTGPVVEGWVEMEIPGSTYTTIGDGIFTTVPAGTTYELEIIPSGAAPFDLRVRDVEGIDTQFIQHTLVYASVDVGVLGSASLDYNPDNPGSSTTLELDTNGDGWPDEYMPPTGELGPGDSYDFEAPSTTIQLNGQLDEMGWYTGVVQVSMSATDNQSGMAAIEYTVDDGRTMQVYDGPFQVVAEDSPRVRAQAIDVAGNREAPAALALLRGSRAYLPLVTAGSSR